MIHRDLQNLARWTLSCRIDAGSVKLNQCCGGGICRINLHYAASEDITKDVGVGVDLTVDIGILER